MKKLKTSFIIASMTLSLSQAFGAEVDPFFERFKPLQDSKKVLNDKKNEMIKLALAKANDSRKSCSEDKLYKEMRKYFRNHLTGDYNKWVIKAPEVKRAEHSLKNSIYQDFRLLDAVILGFYGRYVKDPLGMNLNYNGHFVGTDKFEHFHGSGFKYFKAFYLKNGTVDDALKIGYKAEHGLMGAGTTGVISYGDLVANFNGMRFWNDVLAKHPDILGRDLPPLVECLKGQWVQARTFNWDDYIDHGWDEGINCSDFRTKKQYDKVMKRVKDYQREYGRTVTCPMNPDQADELVHKYGNLAPDLINPKGMGYLKK